MRVLVILTVLFCYMQIPKVAGQAENKTFSTAEYLFYHNNYSASFPLYKELASKETSKGYLNYKIGVCYLNSRSQKNEAIEYFEKAISQGNINTKELYEENSSSKNNNSIAPLSSDASEKKTMLSAEAGIPVIIFKYMGDAYRLIYEFDQAINYYQKYKKYFSNGHNDQVIKEKIDHEIETCRFGKGLKSLVTSTNNLQNEPKVKSRMLIPSNSLVFKTSPYLNAPTKRNLKNEDAFFESILNDPNADSLQLMSLVGKKNCSITRDSISKCNEATVGTSINGHIVLVYRVNKGNGSLYTTSLNNNEWTAPEKLTKMNNTDGWEPDEFISADGTALYFSSNRPGGYGGKDIYKSIKQKDGRWGKASNLGPSINTAFDEEAPFIFPDGIKLYFSSNGHNKAIGCFDIFSTSFVSGAWTHPVNVGYPVDATYDDLVESAAIDSLPVTNNKSKEAADEKSSRDNYIVTCYNDKKASLILIKREILNKEGEALKDIKITVTDNATGQVTGVYYSGSPIGHYVFILPKGRNNNISYEAKGYLYQSEHIDISKPVEYYELSKSVQMHPIIKGETMTLNNVFFNSGETKLLPVSDVGLEKLFDFLNNNPGLKAEVSGYIVNNENSKLSKKLAQDRAQVVVDYLIKKGINTKQMIAKGYKKSNQKSGDEYLEKTEWLELKILDTN